jgi:class 3 adenylate cyclase/CHASE3 domain sensor protein
VAAIADERMLGAADDGSRLPRFTGALAPLVDAVARIKVSVHMKLLAGFLIGATLLLGMGVLSVIVTERISTEVTELNVLQQKLDLALQMKYEVTLQSHLRAMALLTHDDTKNQQVADAKNVFASDLDQLKKLGAPPGNNFFVKVRGHNDQFTAAGDAVLTLYEAKQYDQALQAHISDEHPASHLLEMDMQELEDRFVRDRLTAQLAFDSDKRLLQIIIVVFSAVSLGLALLLGYVLSWSLIRPVRKIDFALAKIAGGDFRRRIVVPNRDEFGTLTRNLNATAAQLASVYDELKALNTDLHQKVEDQLGQLTRASELKRYLAPQLAESIMAGTIDVSLASRRKSLTVLFSDIRGFTSMSERVEPEELVERLNEYLGAMTEIVFTHGGTLDKYIGDAIMVFFGDPIPYEDHAQRAVRTALEMRRRLSDLQREWSLHEVEPLSVGMGMSTGYVTVGNIGSPGRMDYTVIGNHVNLASRLADQAAAGQILASERTLVACRDLVEAREVYELELEGVSRPVKIYEVNAKVTTPTA